MCIEQVMINLLVWETIFEYVHHIEPAVLPEAEELDLEKELAPNVALMRSFIRRLEGKTVGSDEGTSDEVPF